jgi:hypothetical protein
MLKNERENIREKRSSLRSWRERGGKMPRRWDLIGAILVVLILLGILASSLWGDFRSNSSSPAQQNNTSVLVANKTPAPQNSTSTPGIRINSPTKTTYNTSTPLLDLVITGSNLNSVLLSVDKGQNISLPHNANASKIEFARLNPLFIDDFSGKTDGRWKESGNWRFEGGKYISTGGNSSFGRAEWGDYIVEAKTRIISGKDVSIDLRWDGKGKFYRVITTGSYGNIHLQKMNNTNYTGLFSKKLSGIDLAKWHVWKIAANGSNIQVFIDEIRYIEYTDKQPYLKGSSRLSVVNASVEYDYINVYKPLSEGAHSLTVFANDTLGNTSSRTVSFTVKPEVLDNKIGEIGVPLAKNGLEINVKSVFPGVTYTNIWINAQNIEEKEKPFKLGSGTVIIDNMGQQYEKIKVARSSEIAQTNLYPGAMREGSVFFERLKEGAKPEKLVLKVNGDIFEFRVNAT